MTTTTASDGIEVRRTDGVTLEPLRRRILRNNDPVVSVTDPRDGDADAVHLGAFAGDEVVGCGSFYPSTSRTDPARTTVQLRYLATSFERQGTGVGSLLLRAAESALTTEGVEEIWANGRDTALAFYDRLGWQRIAGSEHLSVETGLPHTVIARSLVDPRAVTLRWATSEDAEACAALREEMYFALRWREFGDEWVTSSAEHFARGIEQGSILAVIGVTDDGTWVALTAAALREVPPLPRHPRGRAAYLHSVSVRPTFRHRGLAKEMVVRVLAELDRREFERVELHATQFGQRLYTDLGFIERSHSPEMRLVLREVPE